jgi:hypothetical protein
MFFVRVNRFWCVWIRVPVLVWLRERFELEWVRFFVIGLSDHV